MEKITGKTYKIMRKIFAILVILFVAVNLSAQDFPSGYTPNYGLRMYAEEANPSSDSLNQNWQDVDNAIYQIDTNYIPKSRSVNGKPLTSDIVLNATDILNLDDNFLDPHDFQLKQYIKVDTVGGDTVFVGDTISSSTVGGDGLTKIIYSIEIDHGNWLVTELFNNSGATLNVNVIGTNNGTGDWQFIYNGTPFINKRLLFTPITVFAPLLSDPDDNGIISGYIFSAGIVNNSTIIIRTVDRDLIDAGDVITGDISGQADIILEFIITDE